MKCHVFLWFSVYIRPRPSRLLKHDRTAKHRNRTSEFICLNRYIGHRSQQGATRRCAAASNTATTIIRHLQCQSCASHAHVSDLTSDSVARNAMYSSPARPFILLLYQVTQTNETCQ